MSVMSVVIDNHVVVIKLNAGNKDIYQRTTIIDIIGITFCKALKKEFHLFVFKRWALYLLNRKLSLQVAFLILPLLDLSRYDISSFSL